MGRDGNKRYHQYVGCHPLNSLTFQYAEGLKAFNSQDGAFDVTIQGQETATDFELTAQIISNTLTNASGDASTLNVGGGMEWHRAD